MPGADALGTLAPHRFFNFTKPSPLCASLPLFTSCLGALLLLGGCKTDELPIV
jgi:hypothetical protein